MTNELYRIENNRILFIREVYRQGAKDHTKRVNGYKIGEVLGISKEETLSIILYFEDEDYIQKNIGLELSLTHNGLKFVERNIREENIAKEENIRKQFFETISDLSKGEITHPVELDKISENMGMQPQELENTAQYFIQKGLLKSVGMRVYSLTAAGVDNISQKKKIFSIFLSHWSKEEYVADQIKHDFELIFNNKVKIFVSGDPGTITSFDDWLTSILKGIKNCHHMIVLLSPESMKREWIIFEIGAATILDRKISPICYHGLAIKDMPQCLFLSRNQAIDMNQVDKAEKHFLEIFKRIAVSLNIDVPTIKISECEFFKILLNKDKL